MSKLIINYKNRKINYNEPVEVYRNLNKKGRWYSIRQNGLVVAHCTSCTLKNCTFHVSQKVSERVKKTKKREVHAWIKGTIVDKSFMPCKKKVVYNPYINYYFKYRAKKVLKANMCKIYNTGVYIDKEISLNE